ncbi:DNA gyrase/topoisomerase IV subunit A [Microbacterium rhizomatis]|uniref:DNA topoisomerase (ATP-hydrolyzing) n=1 Tax=Microbacterium rhizomatis TaxID=1631477 RepID=A0A5J5J3A0_9MICO|nr:DNA topoisomerase IV subunit A [Microbacterium rhizomatis]KAA9110516.1 DNA topoisomerase IV subunit A [Microbacterium rhizomatis]
MPATPPQTPGSARAEERIEDVDVAAEMQGSFLEYAYSVIYSRALPDARDGLKPVQRRILYQMAEMGLRPDRGHVKSARVVGEVMGKLHPHGDAPIYDALVRLAQPFSLRVPLVDGHGNFGSLDDGPAAPRYTEARLAPAALALTENLDEDVVDFIPNYDGQFQQPEVLPSAYPNLLVNGATGIAVGMATNMAPHNLIEVVAAAIHLLQNPAATVEDLMEFVPGPDLPSGGIIVGLDGVKDAYTVGRGSFRTRAKVAVESLGPRRTGLVVTELPYLVGPERIIEKIKDAVNAKKLTGIADVTDLTDRHHGLRLVIAIKTGFDPQAVLEQLYRLTPLEDSFSINNVALVQGQPQTLGLKELLRVYIDHRIRVVTRRSEFRLARRRERLHLVEGLLIAILDIDEVIQVIRTSDDGEQARARLIDVFDLSHAQAEYILELRLRRLTKFSRVELEAERDSLMTEIAQLEELLGSEALLRAQVARELEAAADTYGTPRRTLLLNGGPVTARPSRSGAAPADLQIADSPCRVYLSATGRMLRAELSADAPSGGVVTPTRRSKHDAVRSSVDTTTRADLGAVTSAGRIVRFSPVDLPSVPGNSVQLSAGIRADQYLALTGGEHIVAIVALDAEPPIALGTAQGVVKRVSAAEIGTKHDVELIALKPGDRVVGAAPAPDGAELVFVASDAQLLRFDASSVRPQGRSAGGMAGVRLTAGASTVYFGVVEAEASDVLVVTVAGSTQAIAGADPGSAKVSTYDEFPPKGRGTGGVRAQRFLKGEDTLTIAWVGQGPARAVGTDGTVRVLPDAGAKRDASGQPLDGVIGAVGEIVR